MAGNRVIPCRGTSSHIVVRKLKGPDEHRAPLTNLTASREAESGGPGLLNEKKIEEQFVGKCFAYKLVVMNSTRNL